MPDHASHVEWVRAAIRDKLGLTDEGGTVTLTGQDLEDLARHAKDATLNWVVAAAQNGHVKHAGGSDD